MATENKFGASTLFLLKTNNYNISNFILKRFHSQLEMTLFQSCGIYYFEKI